MLSFQLRAKTKQKNTEKNVLRLFVFYHFYDVNIRKISNVFCPLNHRQRVVVSQRARKGFFFSLSLYESIKAIVLYDAEGFLALEEKDMNVRLWSL